MKIAFPNGTPTVALRTLAPGEVFAIPENATVLYMVCKENFPNFREALNIKESDIPVVCLNTGVISFWYQFYDVIPYYDVVLTV